MAVAGDSVERGHWYYTNTFANILSIMEKRYMWQWKFLIGDFDSAGEVKKELPDQVMLEVRFE